MEKAVARYLLIPLYLRKNIDFWSKEELIVNFDFPDVNINEVDVDWM